MANTALKYEETNLVGTIVNVAVTTTATTIYASFKDSKTNVAREPQSTTNVFTIDKDTENFEIILADSHSTTNGITTITVNASGRALNEYEEGTGSATGLAHAIGAEIGCVTNQTVGGTLNKIMSGDNNTTGEDFRVGNNADNDISYYAANGDANEPYIKYDSATSAWVYANDGSSENPMGGAGSITAGDGLDLAAGVMSLDIKADSGLQITATELDLDIRSNYGLIADSNGLQVDLATDPGLEFNSGQLQVKVKSGGGVVLDSDGLSTSTDDVFTTDYTYGETIAVGDLLYHKRSDNRVYKVTSSPDTWKTVIGVAQETGNAADTGKNIQTQGLISGASFSAISPTFTSAAVSGTMTIGNGNTRHAYAFRIDNTGGAEALIDGIVLSLKKQGNPADDIYVDLVPGDATAPAWGGDVGNTTQTGASYAQATKTEVSISGVFEDYTFDFSDIQLPANSYTWMVVWTTGSDPANYYNIEYNNATGTSAVLTAGGAANTDWDANTGTPVYTINFTSVNPWDMRYGVRAYNGTDGGIGIGAEAGTSPWSRVVGHVVSATTWFLDLRDKTDYFNTFEDKQEEDASIFNSQIVSGFRPSSLDFTLYRSTATAATKRGFTDGVIHSNFPWTVETGGGTTILDKCYLQAIALEDGVFVYARPPLTTDVWTTGANITYQGSASLK